MSFSQILGMVKFCERQFLPLIIISTFYIKRVYKFTLKMFLSNSTEFRSSGVSRQLDNNRLFASLDETMRTVVKECSRLCRRDLSFLRIHQFCDNVAMGKQSFCHCLASLFALMT